MDFSARTCVVGHGHNKLTLHAVDDLSVAERDTALCSPQTRLAKAWMGLVPPECY